MTFVNEAEWDRTIRILIGIVLIVGGSMLAAGGIALIVIAIGAVMFITGIAGWCPAYTACGISTRKIGNTSDSFR